VHATIKQTSATVKQISVTVELIPATVERPSATVEHAGVVSHLTGVVFTTYFYAIDILFSITYFYARFIKKQFPVFR
jgi:hypothetical protein